MDVTDAAAQPNQPALTPDACPCCGEALSFSKVGAFWMHHFNECVLEGFLVKTDDPARIAGWNRRASPEFRALAKRTRHKLVMYVAVYAGDKELRGLLADWDAVLAKVAA